MIARDVLPPPLLARAQAQAIGQRGEAVAPRPAATVALLRDTAAGIEVYLLRRVTTMAFAAGMHVFPGGSVDPRDAAADISWVDQQPAAWARSLHADQVLVRALVCAAVRETFEESGVLLAGSPQCRAVEDMTEPGWEADRRSLLDGSLSFVELLHRRRLVLHAPPLRPWAHWVTPEFEPRRYDTRFFVAALPAGQRTRAVGGEADRVAWVRPAAALEAYAEGAWHMLPPTVATLSELAPFGRVADVLTAASRRRISPQLPRPVLAGDDGVRLLLPGEPGYPSGPDDRRAAGSR